MLVTLLLASLSLGDVSSAIGVNIHFTGAPARDLDMIRDAGFGWVRMDFVWQSIERKKGTYRFEPYDELVEGLDARGLRALFILDYSNPLYEAERSVRTEEGRQAFARFAGAAAARYRGRGIRWEIWNEPNLEGFWKPQPAVDDYAALAIESAKAIRAADPDAKILAPATSGIPMEFLDRLFQLDLLSHIDEVSVHPYRSSAPETVRADYAALRELIARHRGGKPPPPIVSGEWGYSTWHHGGKPFSAEVQAAYLVRQLLTNISEGIPLSIWYDWANDGPDPRETEHNFGTVTLDRKAKPAYEAAKTMTSRLGRCRFDRRIGSGWEDHLLVFRDGDRRTLAVWTVGEPRSLTLEVPGLRGRVEGVGMLGEPIAIEADGFLELSLDRRPLYVDLPAGLESFGLYELSFDPHAKGVRARIARWGEGQAEASLRVACDSATIERKVELSGEAPAVVDVPLEWPAGESSRISVSLLDAATGRALRAQPPAAILDVGAFREPAISKLSTVLDGDDGVEAEARRSTRKASEGEPFPGAPVLRLDYRFGAGWRFVRVVGDPGPEIAGPAAFSVWVKGDASRNVLRCRFRDAKGETFQPTGGPVSWTGWRRVELPLDGSDAGSWGGDGTVDWPVRWDSLLLLDSTRKGGAGTIEFASPLLIRRVSE